DRRTRIVRGVSPAQDQPRSPTMIDQDLLETQFARIGARLRVSDGSQRRLVTTAPVALDVRNDRRGEFFEVIRRTDAEAEVQVLDVRPADRHLLLLVRER